VTVGHGPARGTRIARDAFLGRVSSVVPVGRTSDGVEARFKYYLPRRERNDKVPRGLTFPTVVDVDAERGLRLVPWRSSTLYVVLASSMIGVMGVSLVSPVLPDLRSVFGVSDAQVGLVITAYTLPGVVVTPFVGLVADRFGRRRVIVPLLFLFAAAGAGVAFARTFAEVLALRFLQGVGASALITLAVTLIGDVYDGARRDAVMGLNGSTIGTGAALYPLLGGALAGVRWNAPFLFFGVGALVGVFALVALTDPDAAASTDLATYLARLRAVAFLPRALAVFVALFAAFFIFYGAVLTALPLLLSDGYGLGPGRIGATLSAVAVASGGRRRNSSRSASVPTASDCSVSASRRRRRSSPGRSSSSASDSAW
jgi:ACDE family multidrug resistance protein